MTTDNPTEAEDYAANMLRRNPTHLLPTTDMKSTWSGQSVNSGKPDALARLRRRMRREDKQS